MAVDDVLHPPLIRQHGLKSLPTPNPSPLLPMRQQLSVVVYMAAVRTGGSRLSRC